jgi:hypothetical protein
MASMTTREIEEVDFSLYNLSDDVLCFDAYHLDENGVASSIYTWYIPTELLGLSHLLLEGTIVLVENLNDTAEVIVSGSPYRKTQENHNEDLHPYCALIAIISQPEGD